MEVINIVFGLISAAVALLCAEGSLKDDQPYWHRRIFLVYCMINTAFATGILSGGFA